MDFDLDVKVYLFGSRVDNEKRGGDIDLFFLSHVLTSQEKRKIRLRLYGSARELKVAAIRDQRPEWSESEVQERLGKYFSMEQGNLFFVFTEPFKKAIYMKNVRVHLWFPPQQIGRG